MGAELTVYSIIGGFCFAILAGAMFERFVLGRRYD